MGDLCHQVDGNPLKHGWADQKSLGFASKSPMTSRRTRGQSYGQGYEDSEAYRVALFASIRLRFQNEAEYGKLLDFLVDTGSDLTWVAKEGYTPRAGAEDPLPGKEITDFLPEDLLPKGENMDPKIWTPWYGDYGASGRTSRTILLSIPSPSPRHRIVNLS